jgi:hypothetical protein
MISSSSYDDGKMQTVVLLEKCAHAYLLALCTGCKVTTIPWAVREITLAELCSDEKKYVQLQ